MSPCIPSLAVLVSDAFDSDRLLSFAIELFTVGGKIPAIVSSYVGGSSWYDLWSSILDAKFFIQQILMVPTVRVFLGPREKVFDSSLTKSDFYFSELNWLYLNLGSGSDFAE